jgi:hypothetical protein
METRESAPATTTGRPREVAPNALKLITLFASELITTLLYSSTNSVLLYLGFLLSHPIKLKN